MAQVFALEMGSGFVPTPHNRQKEEETLILEGMRFVDRIGKLDILLREEETNPNTQTQPPSHNTQPHTESNTQTNTETGRNEDTEFARPKEPPKKNSTIRIQNKKFYKTETRSC